MGERRVLLWDVGGVLLSNGFAEPSRAEAARRFALDPVELDRRYAETMGPYERGELSLDAFLDRVVFSTARPFSRDDFRAFLFSCSSPHPETIAIAERAGRTDGWVSACFNNEGRELNDYRMRTFGLDRIFSLFFSSCLIGRRKPDPSAYRLVLDVLGGAAARVVFIDDRLENLEPARALGIRTIHYRTPSELRSDLAALGVDS